MPALAQAENALSAIATPTNALSLILTRRIGAAFSRSWAPSVNRSNGRGSAPQHESAALRRNQATINSLLGASHEGSELCIEADGILEER